MVWGHWDLSDRACLDVIRNHCRNGVGSAPALYRRMVIPHMVHSEPPLCLAEPLNPMSFSAQTRGASVWVHEGWLNVGSVGGVGRSKGYRLCDSVSASQ